MDRETLRPMAWYKDHIVRGAREHGLPADYIRALDRIGTSPGTAGT